MCSSVAGVCCSTIESLWLDVIYLATPLLVVSVMPVTVPLEPFSFLTSCRQMFSEACFPILFLLNRRFRLVWPSYGRSSCGYLPALQRIQMNLFAMSAMDDTCRNIRQAFRCLLSLQVLTPQSMKYSSNMTSFAHCGFIDHSLIVSILRSWVAINSCMYISHVFVSYCSLISGRWSKGSALPASNWENLLSDMSISFNTPSAAYL